MLGIDKSTQRVIAAIALLVVAVIALRGYVPGVEEPLAERERPRSSPAALFIVVAMVSAAAAVIGYAIIARMRDRTPRPAASGEPLRRAGSMGRPSWRYALIALALIIGWLLAIVALTSLTSPAEPGAPDSAPTSETGTPPPRGDTAPPTPDPADPGTNVVGYLMPPMLVLMVLIVIGSVVASRRQRRDAPAGPVADVGRVPTGTTGTDSLARAAEVGLAEIEDLSREPRDAIIACYAAMERELTRVPGAVPQDFDTPSEVLARAVAHHALGPDSATELVELFEEARFSPHVMTEVHRDAAVTVLQRVLTELSQEVGT